MSYKKLNFLLIEDDEVDIMTVRRAFKKHNLDHQLWTASNGVEALELLSPDSQDYPSHNRLILLDLNMPKMGGIEFLHQLRSHPELKKIPVIVLTTSNEDEDKVKAYNFNVAGYMIKPVTFESFLETIATLNQYWMMSEIL
ncbi:response regulator [Spirulina sp. CS-785/01]|uniref:response regulator n=1 Tax=Spirulina sp. CS-785/01 TaxID=3021716 RepID=UPI00232AA81B|nr:response regulator [Spirulina sp. CS-785/01]MDB9312320.1 response regulator [Spirulina sp. CS-785/01]